VESEPITVGGASFTESLIMIEMYAALLEDAGYEVQVQPVDNRELYAPELESGGIDVVPEYAATFAEYLNLDANGPAAEPVATGDVEETVTALRALAEAKGIEVLEPSEAANQNAFFVTEAFAAEHSLSTLSDLGASGIPVVLAGTAECPERPKCESRAAGDVRHRHHRGPAARLRQRAEQGGGRLRSGASWAVRAPTTARSVPSAGRPRGRQDAAERRQPGAGRQRRGAGRHRRGRRGASTGSVASSHGGPGRAEPRVDEDREAGRPTSPAATSRRRACWRPEPPRADRSALSSCSPAGDVRRPGRCPAGGSGQAHAGS
jgi:hypothetical protein